MLPDATAERFVSLAESWSCWLFSWEGRRPGAVDRYPPTSAPRGRRVPRVRSALAVASEGPRRWPSSSPPVAVAGPQAHLRALVSERPPVALEIVVSDDGSPAPEGAQVGAVVERLTGTLRGTPSPATRPPASGWCARRTPARPAPATTGPGPPAPPSWSSSTTTAPRPPVSWPTTWRRTPPGPDRRPGARGWAPEVPLTPFMELVVRGAQFNFGAIADPEQVPFTSFYTANCSLRRADLEARGGSTPRSRPTWRTPSSPTACSARACASSTARGPWCSTSTRWSWGRT